MIKFLLFLFVRFYQFFISPIIGKSCRFQTSCSQHMLNSINAFGVVVGFYFGLVRILSCNPWFYNTKGVA